MNTFNSGFPTWYGTLVYLTNMLSSFIYIVIGNFPRGNFLFFLQSIYKLKKRELLSYLISVHNRSQWLHTFTIYLYVEFS
jgi:hypothetical protein